MQIETLFVECSVRASNGHYDVAFEIFQPFNSTLKEKNVQQSMLMMMMSERFNVREMN